MGFLLNYCCCCYDLKSGTFVIGILILIADIFTIAYVVVFYCIDHGIIKTYYPVERRDISDLTLILTNVVGVIGFFVTCLMIMGSIKKKFKWMLPYLITKIASLIAGIILSWYIIITNFINDKTSWGCVYLLTLNATAVIAVYGWLVVYSRGKEIIIENKEKKNRKIFVRRAFIDDVNNVNYYK